MKLHLSLTTIKTVLKYGFIPLLVLLSLFSIYHFIFGQNIQQTTINWGFKIQNVTILGRKYCPENDLLKSLNFKKGDSILFTNIQKTKSNIMLLPWIEDVAITRKYPNTMVIHLVESSPYAIWQNAEKHFVIDKKGNILQKEVSSEFTNLPIVVGDKANLHAASLIELLNVHDELKKYVQASVRVSNRRWDLHFSNGIVVMLPEDNPSKAWTKLKSLHDKYDLLNKDVKKIDLRQGKNLILRLSPEEKQNMFINGKDT